MAAAEAFGEPLPMSRRGSKWQSKSNLIARPFRARDRQAGAMQMAKRKQLDSPPIQGARYRRFHGYDYNRGASLFITFAVKGRRPVFGRVAGDRVDHSPAGLEAVNVIDAEPLRHVGQFVNNVKRWIRVNAAKVGEAVEWEANYHDHICCSRFINEKVDAYIGYNAMK